jgi:hypothetical protein
MIRQHGDDFLLSHCAAPRRMFAASIAR